MLAGVNLANQFAADVQSVSALRMKAGSGDPATLKAVASQFEAMLVQTMLKTASNSSLAGEGDPFGNNSEMKLYRDLMNQQWAQSIVSGRGFGLADMLVKRLSQDMGSAAAAGPGLPPEAAAKPLTPDMNALRATIPPAPGRSSGHATGAAGNVGQERQSAAPTGDHRQRFVQAMLPHAQAAEEATGIPARFMLAQAALESGWGQREIKTADGSASHNLFGIKAGGRWEGQAVSAMTTEYRQGLATKVSAKFRAYSDYAEAFVDYANLLKRRYRDAVQAGGDAQAFVRGVVAGGYASDPAYGFKLEGTIRSVAVAGA
jgi:flagellar protein FlgJ